MNNETVEVTKQFREFAEENIVGLKDKVIDIINQIINGITPDYQIWFVFVISLVFGILAIRWKKEKLIYGIILGLLIFASLRYLGIGG